MTRALALLRVSSDNQDVARQRADIAKLKKRYGLEVIKTLELVGVSGTVMLTHHQTQTLLAELQLPDVQGLAVSSLDRLFRPRRFATFGILDQFADAGKMIWSEREGAIDPASDEGFDRCISAGGKAGSELREIARRCRDGKAVKRAEGRHVNGDQTLPDGLRFDARTGKWSYDEPKVAKVREAYRLLFEDRYTLTEIEHRVGWGRAMMRTLRNPTWRGVRQYPATADAEAFEITLPLEPLLTGDQWNLAQTLLAKRRTWSKETRDQRFLGTGLLVCQCGRKYYMHGDKRRGEHDEYYCATRFKGGPGCGAARLWRIAVDAAILHIVEEYMTDPKFLAAVFRRLHQTPAADTSQQREAELAKLATRRQKWIDQYDADRITKREFEEKMDAVNKAVREIEARTPAIAPPPLPDVRAVIAGLVRVLARFRKLPFFEQRATLRRVVRGFQVVDGTIPEFTLSGAFLGDMAHTNSAQPLRTA